MWEAVGRPECTRRAVDYGELVEGRRAWVRITHSPLEPPIRPIASAVSFGCHAVRHCLGHSWTDGDDNIPGSCLYCAASNMYIFQALKNPKVLHFHLAVRKLTRSRHDESKRRFYRYSMTIVSCLQANEFVSMTSIACLRSIVAENRERIGTHLNVCGFPSKH